MVTVIHVSRSLHSPVYYNEQKVKTGLARLLQAGYYPMDAGDMNFNQKLARLKKLTELNQRTKVNSVHISLNFDPSEKLSRQLLIEIAELYLQKIGFGGQPYLLYEHFDAGHPHVHLVTTNIKPDGKRISLHNLPKNQSEKARREIELAYCLVRAEDSAQREALTPRPVNVERVLYGRATTKRAIETVLGYVLANYKFSSLDEFNAVLSLYFITADNGRVGSRLRQYGGLIYRALDEQGNKVGTPLKASDLSGKPTLKILSALFAGNLAAKIPHCRRVRNAVDLALLSANISPAGLPGALHKEGIDLVFLSGSASPAGELFYVDHIKRAVFSASELGSPYAAQAILERLRKAADHHEKIMQTDLDSLKLAQRDIGEDKIAKLPHFAEILLDPGGHQPDVAELQFRRRRKKRKKQAVESK